MSSWLPQNPVLGANDSAPNKLFGYAVAIDGDIAAVGAYNSDNSKGAVYIFSRSGGAWAFSKKVTASDGVAQDTFGAAVALSGNTLIVGAPRNNGVRGAAYIFKQTSNWGQTQKVISTDLKPGDFFGSSVGLTGTTAIVGATSAGPVIGNGSSGAAYVFVSGTGSWVQQQKLIGDGTRQYDEFGQAVSISGDLVLIGAPGDFGPNRPSGSAYFFHRSATGLWTQQQKVTDGIACDSFSRCTYFGGAVALNDFTALISAASANRVYIFARDLSGNWVEQQQLSPGGARFGVSVSLDGNYAAVGAPQSNNQQGLAYIFVRNGTVWTQDALLADSSGGPSDQFGFAVALNGLSVIVGAPYKASASGSAIVFHDPDPYDQAGRVLAAQTASDRSRANFKNFPAGNGDLTGSVQGWVGGDFHYQKSLVNHKTQTGSALFISEMLYAGGMPMTIGSGGNTCSSNVVDAWRVCCGSTVNNANATGPWRNHFDLKNYFTAAIEGRLGIALPVLSYSTVAGYIDFQNNDGRFTNLSSGRTFLYDLFNANGALETVDTGDYIYIDQGTCNTAVLKHGFLIVGWGEAVDCPDGLNADETGLSALRKPINQTKSPDKVPYVVDFAYGFSGGGTGWIQDPRPRPFYCSAATIRSATINTLPFDLIGYTTAQYVQLLGGAFDAFVYNCGPNRPDWIFVHMPSTSIGTTNTVYTPTNPC